MTARDCNLSNDYVAQIAYYLEMYRRGDTDSARHGLMEIGGKGMEELSASFRLSADVGERVLLLHAIWQCHDDAAAPVLQEALASSERQVWQEALDGLVSPASPEAIEALRDARNRRFQDAKDNLEFRCWVEEAIGQAHENG